MPAANQHQYLERKGVASYGLKQGARNELIIPLYDADDSLITAQRIKPDGTKML